MAHRDSTMGFFDKVTMAAEDPILSLNTSFAKDVRSSKVNLGVGAYKTSDLQPMVLSTIKKAENIIASSEHNHEYLPIDGDKEFLRLISELIFGRDSEVLSSGRLYSAQTIGGTGALRIGADFLAQEVGSSLYLSDPTWANHKPLFTRAGHQIEFYPYYDRKTHKLDFSGMCDAIKRMPEGSIILLHACCHNPTGMDPSLEQWKEISSVIKERFLVPFFDFAYQGFGNGLVEDSEVIRHFAKEGHEMLISYSCSKNFGLYGERVGAFFVLTGEKMIAEKVQSRVKSIVRANYSSPPSYGAKLVKTILSSDSLTQEWQKELQNMRERISEMRKAFASGLLAKTQQYDFSFMHDQRGMFSFSGLEKDHVDRLIAEYGIYMPGSGRINVAGLSSSNLEYVVDAVVSVI